MALKGLFLLRGGHIGEHSKDRAWNDGGVVPYGIQMGAIIALTGIIQPIPTGAHLCARPFLPATQCRRLV